MPRIQRLQSASAILESLRARRDEIEEAILTRAFVVEKPTGRESGDYVFGLREAVTAAFEYALGAIEQGAEGVGSPPPAVLTQAQRAARNRVGLEVVLRRYASGYSVLGDYLQQESLRREISAAEVYALQRELTALFDRLVEAVTGEYRREVERGGPFATRRRADLVKRLVAGELIDTAALEYDFQGWHVAAIASGPEAEPALRELARSLDRRLLLAEGDGDELWAWFGGREKTDTVALPVTTSEETLVAMGEPVRGLSGWRLTHRQAEAAYMIGRHTRRSTIRYAEVALLVAALRDDVLAQYLSDAYLAPLARERDGGATLRETLRAYFAAGRQVASTAASLGVSRQTVANRIQAIEHRLERPLAGCLPELELAMRLAEVSELQGSEL